MRTALLLGASGLVGGHLLRLLAADPRWGRVVTLGRRPLGRAGDRHEHHVVDFERLGEAAELLTCDDAFCALGTTIREAGSEAAFRRVDHDYPVEAARLTRRRGAAQFLLVSSIGANARSRLFYPRVKGEVEAAVAAVGFPALWVFRPAQLAGARRERRPKEEAALRAIALARPLLVGPLRKFRPTPADVLARVMVEAASTRQPGRHVVEADAILHRAATPR